MVSYTPKIKNDKEFKSELVYFKKYFDSEIKKGPLKGDGGLYYVYLSILNIYHIVYGGEIMYSKQTGYKNTRNIEEYQDGLNFLNSPEGKRFIDVLHYFANFYKVPPEQLGGYNV